MKSYSIVRIGDDYVVRADDKSVLKVGSRRRAVQLVTDAAELLNAQPQPAIRCRAVGGRGGGGAKRSFLTI